MNTAVVDRVPSDRSWTSTDSFARLLETLRSQSPDQTIREIVSPIPST